MAIERKASARWQGDLQKGKGVVSSGSGALDNNPYGFNTRFEQQPGTNPEELIGAAHASCFAMALALNISEAGHTADQIAADATVFLEKDADGFSITKIKLQVRAAVPGLDADEFQKLAEKTKTGCPVSKVLNAAIELDAKLD